MVSSDAVHYSIHYSDDAQVVTFRWMWSFKIYMCCGPVAYPIDFRPFTYPWALVGVVRVVVVVVVVVVEVAKKKSHELPYHEVNIMTECNSSSHSSNPLN